MAARRQERLAAEKRARGIGPDGGPLPHPHPAVAHGTGTAEVLLEREWRGGSPSPAMDWVHQQVGAMSKAEAARWMTRHVEVRDCPPRRVYCVLPAAAASLDACHTSSLWCMWRVGLRHVCAVDEPRGATVHQPSAGASGWNCIQNQWTARVGGGSSRRAATRVHCTWRPDPRRGESEGEAAGLRAWGAWNHPAIPHAGCSQVIRRRRRGVGVPHAPGHR